MMIASRLASEARAESARGGQRPGVNAKVVSMRVWAACNTATVNLGPRNLRHHSQIGSNIAVAKVHPRWEQR